MTATKKKPKEKTSPSASGSSGNKPRPFSQDFSGPSKTQQHFVGATNVNNILAQFIATGIDPHAERLKNKKFGYASSQSFEEALRATAEVSSAFESLPSKTRAEFANNPALWLDSISTPKEVEKEIVEPDASEASTDADIPPISGEMDST